jgi:fructose-bisphosphate aldolase/6-deoxy-5-ketofructose 1-phosphate synthase
MELQEKLCTEDSEIQDILLTLADAAIQITALFHPENRKKTDMTNASGDIQVHLDVAADNLLFDAFSKKYCVKEYASEEREQSNVMNPNATYSITVDPLDGSSLVDVNLAVGTILGIWKGDILTGTLVGAAYVVYGPTTILVYSTGKGVHEYILEKDDFILVQENIRMKEKGNIYSIGGLKTKWTKEHAGFIAALEGAGYKLRYSGGLVPDLHQILLKGGGIFTYPALIDAPDGKLRLLFELAPFAFLAEHAGGMATNGVQRIMEIPRAQLHQKSGIYIGSVQEVEKAKTYLTDKKCSDKKVYVPADVPAGMLETYMHNYLTITKNTGRLFLFAGDQKIEHLNDDFFGQFEEGTIPLDDADPEHLFRIASSAKQHIGVFAAQYGLIAKYGRSYSDVPYLVKMNSKSHLVKTKQAEPISTTLVSFEDVLLLKKNSGLNIVGLGYTIYVGSAREDEMFAEAGRLIAAAHRYGMLVVLWIYPRGAAVPDEKDPHVIAGAAGVACCLGADFVKVNYCKKEGVLSEDAFKEAVLAAGRTGLITSGGGSVDVRKFLTTLHKQIHVSGASGNATGRNIHQKDLSSALKMCAAVAAVTYGNKDVDFAMRVYEGKADF